MDEDEGALGSVFGDSTFLGHPVGHRRGCTVYSKVLVRGTVFQSGEDVIVAGCATDEDDLTTLAPAIDDWVAQIHSLYRVESTQAMCMDLMWYYRADDIPARLRSRSLPDPSREVFFSDHLERKQPIQSLKVHAVVLTKPQYDCIVQQTGTSAPTPHIFVSRYLFNTATERIAPLPNDFFPRRLPQTLDQVRAEDAVVEFDAPAKKPKLADADDEVIEVIEVSDAVTPPTSTGHERDEVEEQLFNDALIPDESLVDAGALLDTDLLAGVKADE